MISYSCEVCKKHGIRYCECSDIDKLRADLKASREEAGSHLRKLHEVCASEIKLTAEVEKLENRIIGYEGALDRAIKAEAAVKELKAARKMQLHVNMGQQTAIRKAEAENRDLNRLYEAVEQHVGGGKTFHLVLEVFAELSKKKLDIKTKT